MIILGIDPGIAIVGFGVIEKTNRDIKVLDYGVITTHKDTPTPKRLQQVYQGLQQLIEKYKPDAIALEELFFNNNVTTAITVAQARGVLLIASANYTDNLYEYTPLQIKQALTGNGRAEKKQVQYMVKAILNLNAVPKPDDAADALAVALTHAQTNTFLSQTHIR